MLSALTLAASLSLGGWFGSSEPRPPEGLVVQDLHFGDVLFHYYQDDYFEAITRLMAARQMGRAAAHADEAELLMAGMLLTWGQHQAAADGFNRVLDRSADVRTRDQARFYLALLSWQHGAHAQALDALDRIGDELSPRQQAEAQVLRGQLLLALGRFDAAAETLALPIDDDDSLWVEYARFNLGIALLRAGRTDEAYAALDQVGQLEGSESERAALRDRANVALGFARLQQDQAEPALSALRRVRLEGPYSSNALLALGWARLEQGDPRAAYGVWKTLAERDAADPAVQEARLAMPYALTELKSWGAAVEQYQQAERFYAEQDAQLGALIERLASGQLIASLLSNDDAAAWSWQWTLEALPDDPAAPYLRELIAGNRFQASLKNLRDLRFVQQKLAQRANDIASYGDMLEARQLRYLQREPQISEQLAAVDVAAAEQRAAALDARYAAIIASRDIAGFANPQQLQTLARIDALQARVDALDRAGAAAEAAQMRERLRLARGVLQWTLDRDYDYQVYLQRSALDEVDQLLRQARLAEASALAAKDLRASEHARFVSRIAEQQARLEALSERCQQLIARNEADLQQLAVEALGQRQQRLRGYASEARYALARLYDRLASEGGASAPPPASMPASGVGQ